ncbi:hypothetical protein FANTH_12960 [Fusarium anthophilum]|uniref:Uncharacterized protein n=1 Tax=Fusarium anthophilum TaxID=48485 RepID=A0A8H4YQQ7_9HYPO|nr:hypothetical protein FANTH_12960 [Fusarium anthophilum]
MSTLLLSKLEEFLQPIFLTGAKYPSPRFGHIQVPPYRTGTGDFMESIRLALENYEVTREMLFVVPNVERSLLPPNVEKNQDIEEEDDGSVTPVILTFSELLDALRTTKSMAQEGELWSLKNSTWESGQPLPSDLVLVLCLDPLMSAECALCLVGIVKWAREVSEQCGMADVRVITVSAEPNFNFLAQVVSFTSPGTNVTKLDLAALGEQDPERDSVVFPWPSDISYAERILKELQKNRDHKSLILSFDGGFEAEFKNVLSGREKELIDFVKVEATRDAQPLLNLDCSDKGPSTLFISFVGEVPFQPLDIQGFDKLHVVLGSSPIAGMDWHDASRQLVSLKQPPSREDRNLQIWWIHQPSIPERFLYAGVKALPLLARLGFPRNRLVEGVQLGGFMASLADIASWGISVDRTLTCFVRPTHRVHEMTLKLHAQRLMKQDRFELSGREADVFRAVLPSFAYDHRLALLVALEAGPDVRRVKVQLALMLKHGMNKMLSFTGKAINDSTQYSKLLKECHGLGSSMARNGVMWLSLGILKRHQKMTEQRADYDPKKDRLFGLAHIDTGKAEVVGVEVGKMLALLADHGVDVDTSKSVTHETSELSSEAQDEINLHLLRAYAHSLIVSEDRGGKDAPRICHKVVSTLIDSNMIRAAELHERNSRPVKQGEFQFGISHEMFVDNKSVGHLLLDWTSIPVKTVAQWRSSFGQNVTLKELLDVRVEYRRQVR